MKKTLVDKDGKQVGFNFSPLRLNRYVRDQKMWTATEMETRGKELAAKGISTHASESGGVLFSLEDTSHVTAVVHVIRQAYEKVAE